MGVEDTRKREAQLRESTRSADRLHDGGYDGSALAIDGVGRERYASGGFCTTRAAEQDGAAALGDATPHLQAGRRKGARIAEDIVELACEEEPHVVSTVVLGRESYPGSGQLNFSRPDVLGVADLRAPS